MKISYMYRGCCFFLCRLHTSWGLSLFSNYIYSMKKEYVSGRMLELTNLRPCIYLRKWEVLMKHSRMKKIAASVLLKLFINANKMPLQ